jgi:hypothetical protein
MEQINSYLCSKTPSLVAVLNQTDLVFTPTSYILRSISSTNIDVCPSTNIWSTVFISSFPTKIACIPLPYLIPLQYSVKSTIMELRIMQLSPVLSYFSLLYPNFSSYSILKNVKGNWIYSNNSGKNPVLALVNRVRCLHQSRNSHALT